MSLRRIRALVRRILQQFRHDRRTLALVFVAPLVIMSLLGYLVRGGSEHVPMGGVNQHAGPLGAAVTSRLVASSNVNASEMDESTAESKLKNGEIAGYALFPADFSQSAL